MASIRKWYPKIDICLIKDRSHGAYDTRELERDFRVRLLEPAPRKYGWGFAKLEPLFLPERKRFFVVDSDVAFLGPVLNQLETFQEDFVVVHENHSPEHIREHYFDVQAVSALSPGFRYPGYVFNSGQFVGSSGLLQRKDFDPYIVFEEPRVIRNPAFKCEQGVLNYVLALHQQKGALTLRRAHFMRWPRGMKPGEIQTGRSYPFVLHWAGVKALSLDEEPMAHVLRYFQERYRRHVARRAFWRGCRFWEKA